MGWLSEHTTGMVNLRGQADMPTAITLIRPLPSGRTQKIDIGITATAVGPDFSTDVTGGPQ